MTPSEILAEHTSIAAAVRILLGRLDALMLELAAQVPAPPAGPPAGPPADPPADPPPIDPVDPLPPPVPSAAPRIHSEPVNRGAMVWPLAWAWSMPYQRSTGLIAWMPGADVSVEYKRGGANGDGVLLERTYTLHIDGEPVSTVTVPAGRANWFFTFKAPTTPGWVTLTTSGRAENESDIRYFALVKGGKSEMVPVVQSSLELSERHTDKTHAWAWVPVGPGVARPTKDHEYMPVTVESEQIADQLVPGDQYPPTLLHEAFGDTIAVGNQAYYWDQVIRLNRKWPDVILKDGPRGIGTLCFTTHIEIGRGTQTEDPNSAPRKNIYACDPWRVVRITNTGHITTLVGYRHESGLSGVEPELVGDWSAIPAERRGFDLLWGMCWDSRTTLHNIDTAAQPIPAEDNRKPHLTGPRMYVADSKRKRICRVEFDGSSHTTPAKVSEVATGRGFWDCVEDPTTNTMIASIRDEHRVVRMTFDGEILETLIQNDLTMPGGAGLDARHVAWPRGTVDEVRAQPILAPEGLYLLDGLLYIGSKAQGQITVLDMSTLKIARRVPVVITGNSMFVKLAVSDGSYSGRGTIFDTTFDVQHGARWYGIKPDGTKWITATCVAYPMADYQMAVGIGGGRMICGGSDYGLVRHFKGTMNGALYAKGKAEFAAMHGRLVYGPHGVGRFAVEGSDALRYYVEHNGGAVL
jgi:hypothetical protein